MHALESSSETVFPKFAGLWLRRLGIRRKIAYGYVLAVLITVIGIFVGIEIGNYYQAQAVHQKNLAYTEFRLLSHLKTSILETRFHQQYLTSLLESPQQFQSESEQFREASVEVEQQLTQLQSVVRSHFNNQKPDVSALEKLLQTYERVPATYLQNVETLIERIHPVHLQSSDLSAAQQELLRFSNSPISLQFDNFGHEVTALVEAAEIETFQAEVALDRLEGRRIQVLSLSVLVVLLVTMTLAYYTSRAIAYPLETATKIAQQAADEANFNLQISINSEDEVGQLTNVLNQLLHQLSTNSQALKTTEEHFRLLVEGVQDSAIIMLDPNGNVVSWNSGAEKITGYVAAEIIGQPFSCFYLPEEIGIDQPNQKLQTAIVEGHCEYEGWRVRKDGSLFWTSTVITALRDEAGNLQGFAKVAHDIGERKKAEADVAFQANILSQVNDAVIAIDNEQQITYWNHAAERLYGFSALEVLGQKLPTVVPYQWVESEEEQLAYDSLAQTGAWHGENIHFTRHGERILVESSVSVLKDKSGQTVGSLAVIRDITERKQVEAALRTSESRFRQLFESNIIGIIFADTSGNILEANDAFLQMVGYSQEDVRSGTLQWSQLTPPEYRHLDQQAIASSKLTGSCAAYEKENIRKDGSRVPLLVGGAALDGFPGVGIGFIVDLTQRQQAEEALRESEERFRSLSACSPVGIFLTDTQGQCIYTNPRCQAIAGFTWEQSLGEGWAQSVYLEDRQRVLTEWYSAVRESREYSCEYRFQISQGIVRWVHSRSSPMVSDQGKLLGHVGTLEDITERKQAELEIARALEKEKELSDLKSRFITTTSHEFRTPLSIISSSSEILEHYAGKLDEAKKIKHLQRIQSAVQYMTQLLEDVLLINRAEVEKLEFNPVRLDVVKFCRELVEEVELGVKIHPAIALQNDCPELFMANIDEKLLRQILNNLLSNAIKYSPPSSTINFRLACENERVIFQIRDQGIGIPPEDQARLFESFHRAKNVGNVPGTGLGLAIIKKCVELHQGQIAVESELGVGTTFTVTLPV